MATLNDSTNSINRLHIVRFVHVCGHPLLQMHARAQWLEWRGLVQERQSGQVAVWHLTVPACATGVAAIVPHLVTTVS